MRIKFSFLLLLIVQFSFAQQSIRLIDGWQFLRQDLGGVWESVRDMGKMNSMSAVIWDSVTLPHCFRPVNRRPVVLRTLHLLLAIPHFIITLHHRVVALGVPVRIASKPAR